MLFLGVANIFEKFLPYLDSNQWPFRQATHVTVTTICSIVASLVAGRDAALHAFAYQLLDATGVHPCLCPLFVCHALRRIYLSLKGNNKQLNYVANRVGMLPRRLCDSV